ncbi:hypothetical protein [Cystobacter ferrugineus]|uniref:Uncharacterized protein n=1 Tax=Cystobacter ferrugineus TaxID=83449 RepID=A0A1L9B3B5_9BACT|nr:hypothetical protein [Cystobacter ferrugineus]OJH36759.1 hypothetical protein BON30_30085 [Cystobacter ferrugineus]
MTLAALRLLLAAVLGIAAAVGLIVKGRLHPFISLLCGAFTVGLVQNASVCELPITLDKPP